MSLYEYDKQRYPEDYSGKELRFIKFFRKVQETRSPLLKIIYKMRIVCYKERHGLEIPWDVKIGPGLYIGHPYAITINGNVIIGKNANIHKGVTIGQENRGKRKGTPIVGDNVYFGVNSIVVGNIKIGNNVLIGPGSYVNVDVPDNSIVLGNPCTIIHNEKATAEYINRTI